MSQHNVDYSLNPTGPELLDDYLAKDQENCVTSNSGIQRPTYAQAGTVWLDNSTTPWTWYFYDGTSDIAIGTFNASTHEFISANFANVVNLTTPQTIGGAKTFADKPSVPTPTSVDDVSTVVNRDYVSGIQTELQNNINTKQNNITGAASTITVNNLTGNKALISNSEGKVDISNVSLTELNYLTGVVGNIQTQLNNKAAISQVSFGQNGYIFFSNGFKIQWMRVNVTSQDQRFYFPKSFSSATSYVALTTICGYHESNYPIHISSQAANSFTLHRVSGFGNYNVNVIAVGS